MTRPLEDAELMPLLDALADGDWHSGEALAEAAGISRAALAKRIARLQDWDLQIEARSGLGYRLALPLERLDESRIREAVPIATRSRLRELEVELRIDSTNRALLDADPLRDPQALFAEAQTAGRGRRGRVWRSPFGANLYLSLSWRFPAWPPQLGTLSLAVGVACARALRAIGVSDIGLKWPNDLRIGNDKLGGILIEQRGEAGGDCRIVVGVGLNIAMTREQASSVDQPWTSLRAVLGDAAPSRNLLAAGLLDALLSALIEFESRGFASFIADWNQLDLSAGRAVRIEGADILLEGTACGIDESGALIVESGGRRHHVHSGEVSLRLAGPPLPPARKGRGEGS